MLMSFEATVGFEPTNKGFANLCLTTWPRRLARKYYTYVQLVFKAKSGEILSEFNTHLSLSVGDQPKGKSSSNSWNALT